MPMLKIKNKILPKKLSKDLLTYLIFVVLASITWFGHALTSVRNAVVYVRVLYVGIPDNIGTAEPLPESLQMKVRDTGSRLGSYRRTPLTLTLDLSGQFVKDQGEIKVSAEVLRRNIGDLLLGTSKLQDVMPQEIQVSYFRQREKTVDVILEGEYSAARQYEILSEPVLEKNRIRIFGSRQALDTIRAIHTKPLQAQQLRDTLDTRVELDVPEGIRAEMADIGVMIPVEQFTEKVFRMPLQTPATEPGQTLLLFPAEVTVTLKVSMAHFGEVSMEDVRVSCPRPTMQDQNLPVKVSYHNPYIRGARTNPQVVEFIIEHQDNE